MESDQVAQVRRFHRRVNKRAGALEDHFLGRGRSLGESRVLYEIGTGGAAIRELRARLELDSGYLSRLIHALTGKGLVGGWLRRPEAWDWVVVYWLRWRLKHEHSDSARCSWRPTRRSSKQ